MANLILVTGAAGFVGGYVLDALRAAGYEDDEVVAAMRAEDAARTGTRNAIALDITDRTSTDEIIGALRPTAIIHLAAIAAPLEASQAPRRAWDVNFTGVMNVAEAALRERPDTRFVFAGSSEAYGGSFLAHERIKEDAALAPRNIYGATKAAADIYLGQLAASGANIVRFRPFNHTGKGQSPDFVAPAFARQIAMIERGAQPPTIKVGNLDALRDFLDVRDVARAYVAGLDEDIARPGSVFNLATGDPVKIGDVLAMLIRETRMPIAIEQEASRMRANEIPRASGDTTHARETLRWGPTVPLAMTLRAVLDDWRARLA
jgi:GDP-4-dehydro-6-deoxy-D-mannose reductase